MKKLMLKLSLIMTVILLSGVKIYSQPIPDDFKKSNVSDQIKYVETYTKIYDNFRAIREDVFQYVKKSVNDTLLGNKNKIKELNAKVNELNNQITLMNKDLAETRSNFERASNTKNSMSFLGLEINKSAYNSIVWGLIMGAILLLLIGYYIFNKNIKTTIKAKQELTDLQKEYEDYKQRKRVEHEKMTMSHFKEVKKLKEELSGKK